MTYMLLAALCFLNAIAAVMNASTAFTSTEKGGFAFYISWAIFFSLCTAFLVILIAAIAAITIK